MSKIVQISEWKFPPFNDSKKRLQEAGIGIFNDLPSRKSLKKAILENRLIVDGKVGKTSTWVSIGNSIELLPKKFDKNPIKKSRRIVKILYEDSDLIIVVKPPGILTSGKHKETLCSIVQNQLNNNQLHSSHRLDKGTHGIVVFYKNSKTAIWLGNAFENREMLKTYFALVQCEVEGAEFQIKTKIDQKNAHSIITKIGSIEWPVHGKATLLKISPISGRKHQIRKHLHDMGHPIVGDEIYRKGNRFKGQGLFLSCVKLSFVNPISGKLIQVETDLPRKFKRVLHKLDLP